VVVLRMDHRSIAVESTRGGASPVRFGTKVTGDPRTQ
jgi:hypothetical protein